MFYGLFIQYVLTVRNLCCLFVCLINYSKIKGVFMKQFEPYRYGDHVILQNNETGAVITGMVDFSHTGAETNIICVSFEDGGIKYRLRFSRTTGKVYNLKNFSRYYIQSIKKSEVSHVE